ncbi:MAG: hypothetical protein AAB378_01300 [Patescibacteria group bacterium]
MSDSCKYIVIFPVPEPVLSELNGFMDKIAEHTHILPPYKKMIPHVTFHRPIVGISEFKLKNLVESMALQMRQTRMTTCGFFPFGKQYIVLPIQATRGLATLWVGVNDLLARLPEYEHGEYDWDNTLHITVAEKTSVVFDEVWPKIKLIDIPTFTISVDRVDVWGKPLVGGFWKKIAYYSIAK